MAGQSVIGALRVVLGADTAALDKGLADARGTIANFGIVAAAGIAAAAAAFIAATKVISDSVHKSMDDMDKLGKMSQKIGVPVEQLSALKYAADLSDVSFEMLGKSVGKLSKAMVEAAAKPMSEAANAFRALGVSVLDSNGKMKSSDDVMGAIADKFSGLKDGAGKTAVAMAIFGKAGADMIPLLNDGRESLKDMSEEAKIFGVVLDKSTTDSAQAVNDSVRRMKIAWDGIIVQVTTRLLPTFEFLSNAMVDWVKNSGALPIAIDVISGAMKGLVTAGVIVGAVLKTLGQYISTVASAIMKVAQGDFAGAWQAVQGGVEGIAEIATSTFGVVDRLWKGQKAGAEDAASSTDKASKAQKDFNFAAMGGKNAVDQFIDAQQKSLASQQAEIQTFGLAAGEREALKMQLEALSIATANHTAITAAQQAQLDMTKQKALEYGQALAGLQMTQQNLTPAQLYEQELQKIQTLFDNGKISAETYGEAVKKAAEKAGLTWQQQATSIAGSFSDIATAFASEGLKQAGAAKAFGIASATISMFTGAAKALELPFPANIAAVAAVLAKGAAMVASIKSTAIPKFATGGSFTVPGGISQTDNVRMPLDLAAGERVRIEPNRYGASGSSGDKTFNVNLVGKLFDREMVRDLMGQIEGLIGDGVKFKVQTA